MLKVIGIFIAVWLGGGFLAGLFYYTLDRIKKSNNTPVQKATNYNTYQKQQPNNWTPVYLCKPYKLIGGFRDNSIYYLSDVLNKWIRCGEVIGNNVYADNNFLVGRIESDGNQYRCVLDFRDDKKASIEIHQQYYNEHHDKNSLELIAERKAHPDEYTVATVNTIHSDVSDTGFFSCVSLTIEYMRKAEECADAPQYIKKQWWFDFPELYCIRMQSNTPDAFGLAAVFICFQHLGYLDEQICPFYRMYP